MWEINDINVSNKKLKQEIHLFPKIKFYFIGIYGKLRQVCLYEYYYHNKQ